MATVLPDVLLVAPPTPFRTRLSAQLQQAWPARPVQCIATLAEVAELTHERTFGLLVLAGLGRQLAVAPILHGLVEHRPAQPVLVLRSAHWSRRHTPPPHPAHLLLPHPKSARLVATALAAWADENIFGPNTGLLSQNATAPAGFSPRELEVLQRIADDETSEQIADALCINLRTVEFHRRALRQKAGTRTVAGLVAQGIRAGWVR